MKAVRSTPPGVTLVEVDEPEGPGELVRITSASICASDLRYLRYGSDKIVGHELAGVTADGTPVLVEGIAWCGACEWCEQGRTNLCHLAGGSILGFTVDGGMSEYYRAPAAALVPVPPGLRTEDASIAEPGAVAWHACAKAAVGPDTRVAVVGAGSIGILAVLAAREMGAPEVALEARHDFQREVGDQFGATRPGHDYDVVIEASGTESGLARAVELARPTATVATVSVFPADVTWPYRETFLKEIAVVPSLGYGREGGAPEIGRVAAMLARQPDVVDALITHRFGLDEAARAFEVAATRPAGTFKVVVHP